MNNVVLTDVERIQIIRAITSDLVRMDKRGLWHSMDDNIKLLHKLGANDSANEWTQIQQHEKLKQPTRYSLHKARGMDA